MGDRLVEERVDFQQEPSFRDFISLIRKGLVFALAVGIGAALLTYILAKRVPPTYEATATVLASQPDSSLQSFNVNLVTAPSLDASAYQAAATSGPVLKMALTQLGNAKPSQATIDAFRKEMSVKADASRQSSLIHLTVSDASSTHAANAANAVATALVAWDKDRASRNLTTIVSALQGQITSLDAQIQQAKAAGQPDAGQISGLQQLRAQQELQLYAAKALQSSAVGLLEVLEPAAIPSTRSAPHPGRSAALAFVLGLFMVYGLLLLRDALDTRFRGTEDLAHSTGLPVQAEFPHLPGNLRHLPREASNFLRTNVLFATSRDQPKVILVTGAGSGVGKTSVAMSLAESFARSDYETLLIDADLRKPVIGQEYNLNSITDTPLQSYLKDPAVFFEPAEIRIEGSVLDVVPSFGPAPSPTELLAQGFGPFLSRVKDEYDVIVIDSAPVLPVADTLAIAPHTTGVLFAVSLPSTDRRSAKAALNLLERVGVRVFGTVGTNLEQAKNGSAEYGYGYGYGYGPSEDLSQATSAGADSIRQANPGTQDRAPERKSTWAPGPRSGR